MAREKSILSVSELNDYLKLLLDNDPLLRRVYIRGEISNFKHYASSGHLYFTLKDERDNLRAVMFRNAATGLAFRPEDGMKVIACGRISVYGASGQYQLYVEELQPDGIGSLAMQFEQLKRKLQSEGLFDAERKKPLPTFPRRIGVITSPSGAAVHDIRQVLKRRYPIAEVILYPSAVQGAEAPAQLASGVEFFDLTQMVDVIILGRGGGSIEDLWAFNDEALARTVAACRTPIISAVGHESDFTICDFVADCRAPTPSAAAELAVPDSKELLAALSACDTQMQSAMLRLIERNQRELSRLADSTPLSKPSQALDPFRMRLAEGERGITEGFARLYEQKAASLSAMAGQMEALSPLSVLRRGYAAVYQGNKTVTRAAAVAVGDALTIRFADGAVRARAERTEGEMEHGKESNDV
ncbi:MAG: exodeoxyribonuclease VII large subunit [Clostridia bacterium]|nr:exodeoxyribonuclease VII large subunit [Clostridia bacterium]